MWNSSDSPAVLEGRFRAACLSRQRRDPALSRWDIFHTTGEISPCPSTGCASDSPASQPQNVVDVRRLGVRIRLAVVAEPRGQDALYRRELT